MKRAISTAAFAAAILLAGALSEALLSPAYAQADVSIDFDTFHDALAPYGDWVYSDRWGEVWIPNNVPDDFRPYDTNGYWANTEDYGWVWASNYEWGDIPFHYGRWVNDPDVGWMWLPGYMWSPAWVAWRSNGQYTGWMPLPPDPQFLGMAPAQSGPSFGISLGGGGISFGGGGGVGIGINFNDTSNYYGYSQWYGPSYDENRFAANWVFVGNGHFADRDFQRYEAPRANYVTFIHNTTNITNYTVVNNYIVNRSVDVHVVERAGGHPVPMMRLAQVIRRTQLVVNVNIGRSIQERARVERPRGTGLPDSAPRPSVRVVESLSTHVSPHYGHAIPQTHLFTRATVTKAPLPEKTAAPGDRVHHENGTTTTGPNGPETPMGHREPGAMTGPGGGMTGPNGTMTGPGGTMTGPRGTEPEMHRHEPGAMTGPGGGMTGPNGTMTGPGGTMTGPNGTPPEIHHHETAPTTEPGGVPPHNAVTPQPVEHKIAPPPARSPATEEKRKKPEPPQPQP